MPEVDLNFAIGLPPERAVQYFRDKGFAFSWRWYDLWQEAHAKAFTVAKAMRMDVLSDIRSALDTALSKGMTLQQFQQELEPRLKALGWWGKVFVGDESGGQIVQLGSPWRLQTIYRTNMQVAYMAGRYKEMIENVDDRPYWQYVAVMDAATRPSHAQLNGLVFPADDPFWDSFYPPNDWGCRCRVRALTAQEVEKRGLAVQSSEGKLQFLDDKTRNKENAIGIYVDRKLGIKVQTGSGWNYNPGKASLYPFVPVMSKSGPYDTISSWMTEKTPLEQLPTKPLPPGLEKHQKSGMSEKEYINSFLKEFGGKIGETVVFQDVIGDPLVISEELFRDRSSGKLKILKADRETYLPMLADTIKDPIEIWLVWVKQKDTPRLCKRYIGIYRSGDKTIGGFAVFDLIGNEWTGTTAFKPRSLEYLDKQRAGTLLYIKKAVG